MYTDTEDETEDDHLEMFKVYEEIPGEENAYVQGPLRAINYDQVADEKLAYDQVPNEKLTYDHVPDDEKLTYDDVANDELGNSLTTRSQLAYDQVPNEKLMVSYDEVPTQLYSYEMPDDSTPYDAVHQDMLEVIPEEEISKC